MENKEGIPAISVIIPTYNRAHLVGRAIRSVLNQTYQDFEIIIVDDGSTDDTEKAIRSFENRIIHYIRHERNQGASTARNTGIKNARGSYIAFLDDDDEWLPDKLEKQINIITSEQEQVGMVYTNMWVIRNNVKSYFYSPHFLPEDGFLYKKALDYKLSNIGLQTTLIKKKCFDVVGTFDERLPRLIDLEFFIRLSKYFLIYHLKEPLVNYHMTEKRISSNREALLIAMKLILEKYYDDIKKDQKILATHHYLISRAYKL